MTTAQDQQSRAEFLEWVRTHEQDRGAVDEASAMAGWQAARALPNGIEPVAWLEKASVGYSFWVNDSAVQAINCEARIHLFTPAQVQAMGRVPPFETDAIAVNLMRLAGLDKHKARECEQVVRLVLAAPRPPAAQELDEVVITKNEAGAIVAVTRQDEEGRILSVLAESAAQERKPLDRIAVLVKIDAVLCKEKTPLQAAEEICAMANQGITHPTGD